MKKIILAIVLCTMHFALCTAQKAQPSLKALTFGAGLPFEVRDLKAMGGNVHLGCDFAYPINDRVALGGYVSLGGGVLGAVNPYSRYDKTFVDFHLTTGILFQIGDRNERPYLLAVSPCTGFGLIDNDVTLPLELRFGRMLTDHWYLTGNLTYHLSLAHETATLCPAITAGYAF